MNKQTDYGKFTEEITRTAEAFNHEMTPGRVKTYFDDLADLSLEAVIGGFQYARKTSTFFPKIAEIRKFAEGSVDDKAELAWRTFLDLVRFEGPYPSLQVYDGAIAYAIECMGGWLTACDKVGNASPEMIASYEKNFKASYKLGQMRNEESKYFLGQFENNNRNLGAWKSPTVDQPVCLVRPGKTVKVIMPLSLAEGQLTAEAREALRSGGEALRKYLPASTKPARVLGPKASEEMATPEEVAELKANIQALSKR